MQQPRPYSVDRSNRCPDSQQATATKIEPNTIFTAGEDLLGLLVTQNADGTIVAQHGSHSLARLARLARVQSLLAMADPITVEFDEGVHYAGRPQRCCVPADRRSELPDRSERQEASLSLDAEGRRQDRQRSLYDTVSLTT